MAIPPLLSAPGPDPFAGVDVGYGSMAVGEKIVYEVTREGADFLVTITRTTANGVITGSARTGTPTVTLPASSLNTGRIPTSIGPGVDPTPAPPPVNPSVTHWAPFAGAFTVASDITTTSDGTQSYVTMNTDLGYITAGTVGGVYTASVQVKAANAAATGKTAYLIFRERRSDGSAPSNDGAAVSVVLTTSYQTVTSTYTATENNSAMDLRLSLRGITTGAAFTVPTVPTWSSVAAGGTNQLPVASFTYSPTAPTTSDLVTFTSTSYDPDGVISAYSWDTNADGFFGDATGSTATHTFGVAGTYVPSLRVTDNSGAASTNGRSIVVTGSPAANVPPSAKFTFTPAAPVVGDTVTFTSTSTDSDGTIASLAWDTSGNGAYNTGGTANTATKVFSSAGTFTVGLKATDNLGATGTVTHSVAVTASAPAPTSDPFKYPFDPLALVNQKITGLAVRSDSAAAATMLVDKIKAGKVGTNNAAESPSIYISNHATQSTYAVSAGGYTGTWYMSGTAATGGGSDHPLVLRDANHPTHGLYAELRIWQATISHANRTITGAGSGLFRFNNDGVRLSGGIRSVGRPFSGDGAGNGLTYTAGIILASDVASGVIPHVLRFAYGPGGQTSSGPITSAFVAPAIKSDQSGVGTGTVPMGTRFRLKSSVNANDRTVPGKANTSTETRFLRMFVVAAQQHGIMPSDGTSSMGFYMEADASADWNTLIGARYLNEYSWIIRNNLTTGDFVRSPTDGVPWDQFEVVVNVAENL